MDSTISEIKNTLEGINSRIIEAEEWVSDVEKVVEITVTEKKGMKRTEESLRDLWDNIKCTNIHTVEVPEGEEREKIVEEIIDENFPNMGKETLNQVEEA